MSIARSIKRKNPNWEGKEPYHKDLPDGGYIALHPTKGFQKVSGKRVEAREKMAKQFGFIR